MDHLWSDTSDVSQTAFNLNNCLRLFSLVAKSRGKHGGGRSFVLSLRSGQVHLRVPSLRVDTL